MMFIHGALTYDLEKKLVSQMTKRNNVSRGEGFFQWKLRIKYEAICIPSCLFSIPLVFEQDD